MASSLSAQESPPDSRAVESGSAAETQAPPVNESSLILGEIPDTDVPAAGGASSVFVMLRMVLVLALAALAIYGVVFFIKRLARPEEGRDPHLKVLARVPLSSDSFAAVISLGAKAWLVAGGSGGVNTVSEIDDPETLETLLLDDARRNAGTGNRFPDFRSILRRFGRPSGEAGVNNPGSPLAENLRKQRERLKGL